MLRPALAGAGGAVVLAGAPLVASVQPVRRLLTPALLPDRLSGVSDRHHVALTFDDGPDRDSTPSFLDLLGRHDTRATFFLLGRYAAQEPALVRRMVAEGHEIGVHGWTHRCVAAVGPRRLAGDLRATRRVLEQVGGRRVRWYRPPYGVLTTHALVAARSAGLDTVLWSEWGVDWRRGRTPQQVVTTVRRKLRPGGTVLLHDTDRTSAPGSWRATLGATERLLEHLANDDVPVGPLAEHGL
ncbi:MAG TPA: polysaccharide deacetylase family protein [Nocardioides sp.]|jgi:peptidoglycan/xylan/chitin deacetylase (PgdA/CDA1 family)|nr:polysaccharide deacetylase family protein [Nocardioides sp.]